MDIYHHDLIVKIIKLNIYYCYILLYENYILVHKNKEAWRGEKKKGISDQTEEIQEWW